MSAASNPRHRLFRPSPSRPSLSLVAERLEATVHELGWGGPPLLVGLGAHPHEPGGPSPLPKVDTVTDDPVADLLGYVVPADCTGLAVVAEGTGRCLVDTGAAAETGPAAVPYRLAYVVDRTGRAGCAIRARGAEAIVDEHDDGAAQGPTGRLVDVCRRAMGLSTGSPPADTARLWSLSWLDLLLGRAVGGSGQWTWSDAARLHPALTLLEGVEGPLPAGVDVEPQALGRMGRALGRAQRWDELRWWAADGSWNGHGITPGHAAWMDAGMFARWVIGEFLPESIYLRELADVLPTEVAERVATVVSIAAG